MSTATVDIPFMDKARLAWGEELPDWIAVLAQACDDDGQRRVADRLGRSPALVSNVLRKRYGVDGHAGDLKAAEDLVRGALMNAIVSCPVLGEIGLDRCREEARRPFMATSSLRAQLYRACQSCPHHPAQNGGSPC